MSETIRVNQLNSLSRTQNEVEGKPYPEGPALSGCGDYTGKCGRCGSTDLWDDCTAYGCKTCGMTRITG
jgi:hypothetical protein